MNHPGFPVPAKPLYSLERADLPAVLYDRAADALVEVRRDYPDAEVRGAGAVFSGRMIVARIRRL